MLKISVNVVSTDFTYHKFSHFAINLIEITNQRQQFLSFIPTFAAN